MFKMMLQTLDISYFQKKILVFWFLFTPGFILRMQIKWFMSILKALIRITYLSTISNVCDCLLNSSLYIEFPAKRE